MEEQAQGLLADEAHARGDGEQVSRRLMLDYEVLK